MFSSLLALSALKNAIVSVDLSTKKVSDFSDDIGWGPDGIVADRSNGRVYWTCMGKPTPDDSVPDGFTFDDRNGSIGTVSVAESQKVQQLLPDGALTTGKQIAFDGKDRLYWSDREGCKVSSCRIDGTDIQDLIVRTPGESILNECVGITLDMDNGFVYWSQKGPAKGGQGRIFRAPLDFSGDPATRSDIELLWENLPEPIDLEIHDGYLYWTDRGKEPLGNTFNRAPLPEPATQGQAPQILAGGFKETIGLSIDADAEKVYISDLSGGIYAVDISNIHEFDQKINPEALASDYPNLWGAESIVELGVPLTGLCGLIG